MVTESEIRARLTKRLRGALTDREWDFLARHRYVEEALNAGPGELDEALQASVSLIKDMRAVYPDVEPAGSTSPGATLAPTSAQARVADVGERTAAYALALSENVAAEADRDRQAAAFRARYLPDGLLRLDQVEAWISARADPPEATLQAVLGVPAGWDGPTLTGRPARVFAEQLEYVVPGASHVQRKPVAPGSVLGRLRHLTAGLAAAHGWEPAQAATWVLTGVTPLIGLIRVTEGADNIRDDEWTAWSERITLDVHPAVAPEEVTAAYRAARSRLDHERTGGEYRARSLQVPQLVLARFVARRRATTSWEQLRREWNAWAATQTEYSELKLFDFESTFRRAATLARKRVLYRGLFARRGATAAALADDERLGT